MTNDYLETSTMISKVLENADDRALFLILNYLHSPLDDLNSAASALRKELYALYKNDD